MTQNTNTDIQNILKNISTAHKIAVVLPKQVSIDVLCAALALQAALTDHSDSTVSVMIFSESTEIPPLPFLRRPPVVHAALSGTNQLAIKIGNKNAQPGELRYEKTDSGLTVYISPKEGSGEFNEKDVTVLPSASNFDLVVIIGAQNFEQLGKIYTENTKLFFETPNINVDNSPNNEYYGTINYVHTTASSFSEVVMDIVEGMPTKLKNNRAVTTLLAGIISQTGSFRDPKTTPQSLLKASRLVEAGARQQDIIQHLFKTKPLPLLQLWGRALARLNAFPDKKALTAAVTTADLEKTKVAPDSFSIVVRDIVEMVTGYSLVVFIAETSTESTHVILAGLPYENVTQIAHQLIGGEKSQEIKCDVLTGKYEWVAFELKGNFENAQQRISDLIERRSSMV